MESPCPSCGVIVEGGAEGCQELFEHLGVRTFKNFAFARFHRMAVDAYSLQHPDRYCASAKSLMAHLGGLCCAFDHNNDPAAHSALQRSLNGTVSLTKPELPHKRGALTIAHALSSENPDHYEKNVKEWAQAAWDAYSPLHPYARSWITRALHS